MSDPEKKEDAKPAWSHGQKLGSDRLREEILKARKATAATLAELQREVEQKRSVLNRFGRR